MSDHQRNSPKARPLGKLQRMHQTLHGDYRAPPPEGTSSKDHKLSLDEEVEITNKSNRRIKLETVNAEDKIVGDLKDHFFGKHGSRISRDTSGSSSLNEDIFDLNRSLSSSTSFGDDSSRFSDSTFGFQSQPVSDSDEEWDTPPHRHSGSRKSSSPSSSLKKAFNIGKSKLFKGGGSGSSN